MNKVIIIGGGIAAHTAAIYTARASLQPLVLSAPEPDQLSTTNIVENWPGTPDGILGPKLTQDTKKQAQKFGAKYILAKADSFKVLKNSFEIIASGKKYAASTVIICTGASSRKLDIPREKEFWAKGVSTCATCDAPFYKNKTTVVIGGGDSAMEETLALSKFAKKIYLIHRRDEFRASKLMQDKIKKLPKDKLEIILDFIPIQILGDKSVTGIKIKNVKTNQPKEISCDGIFLAIGHIPNTDIFKSSLKLDKKGFIITNKKSETSLLGVFAAGDCQDSLFKQAITSAGVACQAALMAEKYLEGR
ncbi:MAG: thioredoxin-disulfide reductase [Nanoarchaeota archaeon]|jgi:thioredoxin reductase (NADPH)|nr:thioredoxin-disulfide reductase [Nanoarchaeota archaeon]|tara:strand:+ start:7227 stop:8141 length:915 start_codon:yes stop_codon:yes gene_type:complete